MEKANVLIIEDDDIVARTIERLLRGAEFHTYVAGTGVDGLQLARRRVPDLVILDVIMPGMNGYEVCQEMRADPLLKDVPILFLTAKAKDEDRISGFKAGADDYLSKPFNMEELILRVRAILKRARGVRSTESENDKKPAGGFSALLNIFAKKEEEPPEQPPNTISACGYTLNTQTFELDTPHIGKIRLTPVQFDLLYHLMCHPNEIFSPARLLDEVWNYPSNTGSPDLVRVHIKNLRERVEVDSKNPNFIKTVSGYGYTISTEED
ncbi:MAG: response regulator transcription factor [Chloroflexi bacterium]|nr:response regulator transcription factor [Chloroflexota bacterium]